MRTVLETEETSEESSPRSTHSSDTSFELSTLIEETDREKLGGASFALIYNDSSAVPIASLPTREKFSHPSG